MSNIKEVVRKRARGIFRLRRINKGRELKMNRTREEVEKEKRKSV